MMAVVKEKMMAVLLVVKKVEPMVGWMGF